MAGSAITTLLPAFSHSLKHTLGLPAGQGTGTFAAALFSIDSVLQRQSATNAVTKAQLADLVRAYNQGSRLKLYHMRFFLLFVFSLGARLAAQAQVSLSLRGPEGAEGSYVLFNDPQPHAGLLKVSAKQLAVKNHEGQKFTLRPGEVTSLRVGQQRYTTAQGFTVRNGLFEHVENDKVFVELLDSGRVSLLRYTSRLRTGQLGTASDFTAYLVREGAQPTATTLYADNGSYLKNYQDLDAALRPYAANRADLLRLLDANRVGPTQLTRFFHALNTNSDF